MDLLLFLINSSLKKRALLCCSSSLFDFKKTLRKHNTTRSHKYTFVNGIYFMEKNTLEICNKKDVLNRLFLVNIPIYKFNILAYST